MDALICAVVLSAVGPADIERPEPPQTHMLLDGLTVLIPDGKDRLGIGFQRDMDSHQIPDANPQRRVHLIRVSIKPPPSGERRIRRIRSHLASSPNISSKGSMDGNWTRSAVSCSANALKHANETNTRKR